MAACAKLQVSIMDAVDLIDEINDHADQFHSWGKEKIRENLPHRQHDDDFDTFFSSKSLEETEGNDDTMKVQMNNAKAYEKEEATSITNVTAAKDKKKKTPNRNNNASKRRFVVPQDFELLKVIGMGAFGKVLQVRNKCTKQVLAMKVISKRLLRKNAGYIENIQAERNILTRVSSHPFVVTMHCSFQNKETLFIIMDFLAGGELFMRLEGEDVFSEKTASFYLAEIISALDHLHSLNILHRDLKPENILLCKDGHICLTDFGLSKEFEYSHRTAPISDDPDEQEHPDHRAMTICGTHEYMAPEMVAGKGYGRAADYWSLGCIAYEMFKGEPPFQSMKGSKDLFRKIMSERVKMPAGATAPACKLLKGFLNRNPYLRLGAARSTMFEVGGITGLKQHIFFTHINWEKLQNRQIVPPIEISVDHDEDLQHFHDEFTTMELPQSFVEASKDNVQPNHETTNFRGFSFIHDDFLLPERREDEVKNYSKTPNEDGKSLSECQSSKSGHHDSKKKIGQKSQQSMVSVKEINDGEKKKKKKRSPRRRKKKSKEKKNTVSFVSSSIVSVDNEIKDATTKKKDNEKLLLQKQRQPTISDRKNDTYQRQRSKNHYPAYQQKQLHYPHFHNAKQLPQKSGTKFGGQISTVDSSSNGSNGWSVNNINHNDRKTCDSAINSTQRSRRELSSSAPPWEPKVFISIPHNKDLLISHGNQINKNTFPSSDWRSHETQTKQAFVGGNINIKKDIWPPLSGESFPAIPSLINGTEVTITKL